MTGSARSYAASGVEPGERIVSTYNAGPFVAGAALDAIARIGLAHVPVGTGNTERLVGAIQRLRPDAVVLTPSYAAHLLEWAEERGVDLRGSTVRRVLVAGEPGGGEPAFRAHLEEGWGARVTEAMGIGDIGPSLWGECEQQDGMHLGARGFVHAELIDPDTAEALPLSDGAQGELVLTHLRHRAAPLLRFRTRDHVVVKTGPCACGRTAPRVRCIGRTDDMLIVRGVNVFPSAIREVVGGFAPRVSGAILVRPQAPGVKQEPPLPVTVELARGAEGGDSLADAIRESIRSVLVVSTQVELVPWGSLERSEYKLKLIESQASAMRKLQSQGVHHITLVGADRRTSIDFWEGVLGMPFVFEQPNLDNENESHLYFDPGDGRLITVFTNEERVPDPTRTRPTPAACTTSPSRSRTPRSGRRSSGSRSAASSTAASRTAASWTRSTSRTRSA